MDRHRGLGLLAIVVGVSLFVGLGVGLHRAVRGEDLSAFFVTPFLLTAALVCLGVGFHLLWGHPAPRADPENLPPEPPDQDRPASP